MEFILLIPGLLITATFIFVAYKNRQRMGLLHAVLKFDTFIGIGAGVYVTITSLISIIN